MDPDLLMKASLNLQRKRVISGSLKVKFCTYVGDEQREISIVPTNSLMKVIVVEVRRSIRSNSNRINQH